MVYVGVVAQLWHRAEYYPPGSHGAVQGGKTGQLNYQIIEAAYRWSAENLGKRPLLRADEPERGRFDQQQQAAALGTRQGVTVAAGIPSPSTSLSTPYWSTNTPARLRTGKETVAVVQAEDELALSELSWGRLGRSRMTSTSGPASA
jgi:hypothetical protein